LHEGIREDEAEAMELTIRQRVHVEREALRRLADARATNPPAPSQPATSRPSNVALSRSKAARSLSEVIHAWAKERQPQARTVQIAERCARRVREMVGPVPVAAIQRAHVIAFKDALLADGQTAVNTDKILTMLSTLLSYAHDQGWLSSNSAKGVKVGARSNAKAARFRFDLPGLELIFRSLVYTQQARPDGGAGETAYWLSLLALDTGARLEELAASAVRHSASHVSGRQWLAVFGLVYPHH
jgi:integrase